MQFFKKVFIMDINEVSKIVEDSFFMCGSKNWDYYFTKKDKSIDFEELKNVKLIEFSNKAKFDDFILKNDVIDYTLEHKNPMVLCNG